MTMTGPNSVMKDELHPEHLVDETLSPQGMGPIEAAVQAVKNLILPTHHELIRQLRIPTPQKVTKSFTADASGNIGGGLANPSPLTLFFCPESVEAWVHRMAFTSAGHGPSSPLTTGEIELIGSQSGEIVFFLPVSGVIAPVILTEGRASAPHLNSGETLGIVGDTLPAGTQIRVDLQILLVAPGVSAFTPNDRTPGVLLRNREGLGL